MAAGVFGYMGYDTVRLVDHLPGERPDALGVPDALLMRPTLMVIFDAVKDELTIVTPVRPSRRQTAEKAYAAAERRLKAVVKTLEAPIEQIVPYAEPGARTLLIKVRLPEDSAAVAGMFARIGIPAGSRKRSIIPGSAVRAIGQLEFVYVVHNGEIEQRIVTTGEQLADGRIELLSGLEDGATVVTDWTKVSR